MSENVNQTAPTGPVEGKAAIQPTLKLVVNRTHLGPVTGDDRGLKSKLSKAANKIRINSDLKVVSVNPNGQTAVGSTSESTKIVFGDKPPSASQAVYIMEAWDRVYKSPGSPAYVRRANALSAARSEVYRELGINPDPKGKMPTLTEEQRAIYNERLKPFAFDYWEARLSWKLPGKKAVRSLTYRSMEKMELTKVVDQLNPVIDKLVKTFTVQVKPK